MTNNTGRTVGKYSGHDVVDKENHKVGKVTDVIYDDEEDRPEWLIVDPGPVSAERVVPVDRAYTAENGNIVLPYDKQHVMHAPKAPSDHVLTRDRVEQLDAHYEVDHDETTSTTSRYLLFVDGPVDAASVRARLRASELVDVAIHVVVPARDLNEGEERMVEIEGPATDAGSAPEVMAAQWRLRGAIGALQTAGFDQVTGAIGDASPVEAIDAALDADRFDDVIVVTKPTGLSGWVHLDLPHRIERHLHRPIIHIEVEHATS